MASEMLSPERTKFLRESRATPEPAQPAPVPRFTGYMSGYAIGLARTRAELAAVRDEANATQEVIERQMSAIQKAVAEARDGVAAAQKFIETSLLGGYLEAYIKQVDKLRRGESNDWLSLTQLEEIIRRFGGGQNINFGDIRSNPDDYLSLTGDNPMDAYNNGSLG